MRVGLSEKHRDKLDPWYKLLPFRGGNIYPHGGDMLAVEVERRPSRKANLKRLNTTSIKQEGDHCGAFLFHVDDFDDVAELVKP